MRKFIYGAVILMAFMCCFVRCTKKEVDKKDLGDLTYLENTENLSPEERGRVLDSMWGVARKRPDGLLTDQMLKLIAYLYYYDDQYPKQRSIMRSMFEKAEKRGDSVAMAYSLYNMATSYDGENITDSAYFYHLRAGKIYETLKDTINIGLSKHYSAKILMQHGNYAEAEAIEVGALKLFKQANSSEDICGAYSVLASCLLGQNNYNKALEYYNKALNEVKVMEKKGAAAEDAADFRRMIYGNMGVVFDKKGDYKEALKYYNRTLGIAGITRHQEAVIWGNRGYAKMMMGNPESDYLDDLYESLRVLDSMDAEYHKLDPEKSIAKHFLRKGDTLKGVALLKTAYRDAVETGCTDDMLEVLSLLITSDRKQVVKHSQEYFNLNDSVHDAERATRDKFARISYETDAIEHQNKELNRRFNYTIAAIIVLLILAVSIIAIIRLKAKNKELVHNQHQQEANEKIYNLMIQQEMEAENARINERNRLAMELHDGIINRIFTTRFNLMQLDTPQTERREELINELQETQDEIRQLSHDLKENFVTENESFAEILKQETEKLNEMAGTVFDVYIDKFINWSNVSPECRVALLRIVQEACTNARKYSKAETCHVALMAQADKVKLRIWDDGVGFDSRKSKPGIGLRNMYDRVKALGGTLNINSSEGNGVVIEAVI
nr:sensor histidine kinase [uncultured Flavobacterium sp.]